ncbi:MAG: dihydroneopterin aldolase [Bacteroides sp.]|nr:dihydroneopterin aldolase [Roseburia sp.]MCM1345836.1 dihydroneopterin aldolase [Bacteroides sp.]MCM1420226.1 dihydroneopterin aldolase [Bacteroides sp.]
MQSIILKELKFYSYHGVLPQERKVGAYFTINLKITTKITEAIFTDELEDTINYAEIYDTIKKEMAHPAKLLEHVAGKIVTRLFEDFLSIESIDFYLFKDNPPIGADHGKTGFELNITRKEFKELRKKLDSTNVFTLFQ